MEPSVDDGLKWFGEGFDGFPKRLPEDTVEYAVYIVDSALDKAHKDTRLKGVLKEANSWTKELLDGYIWQRESFGLSLELQDGTWSLRGQTNFGDSVADEWLIVYILRELSRKHPDLWIRVYDSDGEFLLIEAANVIPRWLKPEISERRVWLHAGQLKIIPRQASTPLAFRAPTLSEAISYLQTSQQNMTWSPLVEEEAFYRIRKYPKAINEQFHHAIVRLPRTLAYILHQNPAYISPAIEAFYLRDPIAFKPLKSCDAALLRFAPDDFVNTSVKFTKVGFAQLRSQEFDTPETWQQAMLGIDNIKENDRTIHGMKLACGFEMLVQDKQNQDKKVVREVNIILEDLEAGEEQLPTNEDIQKWSQRDDDEGWMDIDFNDFEKELSGKAEKDGTGFGDGDAQEQLRKMVSRFEAFMNDDKAGLDGADLDEGSDDDDDDDEDNDEDDDESTDSDEDEDREISFDEEEFSKMMRHMMGLPPEEEASSTTVAKSGKIGGEEEDDHKEIEELSNLMGAELAEAGVLNLAPASRNDTERLEVKDKRRAASVPDDEEEEEDENAEVDIDFNLAKNMLDAFKSQGGAPGPAGNLMGLMGVKLPLDKDDK